MQLKQEGRVNVRDQLQYDQKTSEKVKKPCVVAMRGRRAGKDQMSMLEIGVRPMSGKAWPKMEK